LVWWCRETAKLTYSTINHNPIPPSTLPPTELLALPSPPDKNPKSFPIYLFPINKGK